MSPSCALTLLCLFSLLYLPSADKIAAEKSAAVAVERVPSSAGLSDAYTDATTDDERNELWSQPKTYSLSHVTVILTDYIKGRAG